MAEIGTPLSSSATKVLFCGAGELGKEVIIEMMRLGVEVVAVDRYANAPGMQVAHRSYVINMLDGAELRRVIEQEKPDFIVPEVEAIATDTLVELEKEGFLGKAEVREVFKISGVGQVAGCYVTEGKILRSGKLRIYRDDVMICEGNVNQLKRFKDDVKEVAQGFECGISIERFNDIKVGDFIESYQVEEQND